VIIDLLRAPTCIAGDRDPDTWFPPNRRAPQVTEAKKACAECPVQLACLEFALANDERFGIWGGLDEDERDALRKRTRGVR
jgi:WhiB family redox-sensing transcriptional regulator